jgi:hypothetical protein
MKAMRIRTLVIGIALLSCSTLLYAQQGLLGTYTGTFRERGGEYPVRVSAILEITSAENGKLAGKLKFSSASCSGDYVIDGAYQDSKLEMLTSEGAVRGCGKDKLVLVAQGNKLVGKYGANEIELSKK